MKKVLVVDNNPVLLKAVSTILEQCGCDVEVAENGLHALDVLERFTPDIVFTDMIMPLVGGEQLCKIIRNNDQLKDCFLVVLTAINQEDLDQILAEVDYNLCVIKGSLKELRNNINEVLRIHVSSERDIRQTLGIDSINPEDRLEPTSVTTELLSEKRHLTKVIANLSEGVLELTQEGKIVYANSAAVQLLQASTEELIGREVTELNFGKHNRLIERWFKEQLQTNIGSTLEIQVTDPIIIGERYATASFLPVVDKTNTFAIVILRDITRQHTAEEHKRKLDRSFRLIKKMEAMSGMAGGVAHDFNNLLTVICGNLDLLSYTNDAGDWNENISAVNHAQQAAYAATDLVRKISCFSSFGIISREKVSVGPLVNSIVKKFFQRNSSKFFLDIQNAESLVNIDREQIQTALENVLENAVEARGREKIVVKTSTINFTAPQLLSGQYVPSGKFIRIDVIDSGEGIAGDKILKIFDPYYSSKARGSDKGMGLGLTVVYSTLRNHGGYVVVQSELSKGTSVSFFLPYVGDGQVTDPKKESEEKLLLKGRVLLMEDEEPLRDIGSIMLDYLGYDVIAVDDKDHAIETFKEYRNSSEGFFDLVILNLYGEDGEEGISTCKELLKIDPDMKAIATSGAILHPVMADCFSFGFKSTLPKPYTIDNLRHAIESVS